VRARDRLAVVAVCCLATACATTEPAPAPPPAVPPPKEAPAKPVPAPVVKPKPPPAPEPVVVDTPKEPPRSLGLDELAKGVRSYEEGDYAASARQLQASLDLGLASPTDRANAHKHLAFIACGAKRIAACRTEFRKAFAADPAFDLSRAEAGHPTWGPVFRGVKAEVAKAKARLKPKPKGGT
jgi:hypothetical protein